jgi:hypothetical protein
MTVAAAPVQLALPVPGAADADQLWLGLPEASRLQVLAVLARMIARVILAAADAACPAGEMGAGDA